MDAIAKIAVSPLAKEAARQFVVNASAVAGAATGFVAGAALIIGGSSLISKIGSPKKVVVVNQTPAE